MSDWPNRQHDGHRDALPDAAPELELADDLIDKANALLWRHRAADPLPTEHLPDLDANADEDDIPILTEVVEDFGDEIPVLQDGLTPPPVPQAGVADPSGLHHARLVEHLVEIDTLIAREVETWLSNELPQLLSRELDSLSERLRIETLAHLRATLLPTLSNHIASRLDELER